MVEGLPALGLSCLKRKKENKDRNSCLLQEIILTLWCKKCPSYCVPLKLGKFMRNQIARLPLSSNPETVCNDHFLETV